MTNILVMADLGDKRAHENAMLITGKEVVHGRRTWRWGHGSISVGRGENGVIFAVESLKYEIWRNLI
jgi:hypothetical protein